MEYIPFFGRLEPLSSTSYFEKMGLSSPSPVPTTGEKFLQGTARVLQGSARAGKVIWNAVGGLGDGILSLPEQAFEKISTIATDAIILSLQGTGNAIAYASDLNNPIISSYAPIGTSFILGRYGYNKLHEGFSDRDWVSIKKTVPRKNKGQEYKELRFIPDNTGKLKIEFDDPKKNSEYRILIPLTQNDIVLDTNKTSKTATALLKGLPTLTLAVVNGFGAIDRMAGLDFARSGITGWTISTISAIPNRIVGCIGGAVANTSPGIASVALTTIFTYGALRTISSINFTGEKDGLLDLEQQGWSKVNISSVAKNTAKAGLATALMICAAVQVSNIFPGLKD